MTITMSHSTVLGIILATICCSGISTSLFDIQEEGIAVFDMSMSVPLLVSESGWNNEPIILTDLTTLPRWCYFDGITCDRVITSPSYASILRIDVSSTNIADGTLPPSLGNFKNIQCLSLRSMGLVGAIPDAIGSMTSLSHIYLNGNKLTGTIPSSIVYLKSLELLDLYGNQLMGSAPETIGLLGSLRYLDLSLNKLTGTIPESVGFLTSLKRLYLDENRLMGSIPDSMGLMTSLELLYLNDNKLSGTIPETMGSMTSLQLLVMSANQLEGTIPSTFNQLEQLNYLYLNSNYLTMGSESTVPTSTFSLTTLASGKYLSLDQNCLVFSHGTLSVSATRCKTTQLSEV